MNRISLVLFLVALLAASNVFGQSDEPVRSDEEPEVEVLPPLTPEEVRPTFHAPTFGIAFGAGICRAAGSQPNFYFGGLPYDHDIQDLERTPSFTFGAQAWATYRLHRAIGLKIALNALVFKEKLEYRFTSSYAGSGPDHTLENGRAEFAHGSNWLSLRVAPSFHLGERMRLFVNPGMEFSILMAESWQGERQWTQSDGTQNFQYVEPYSSFAGSRGIDLAATLETGFKFKANRLGSFLLFADARIGLLRSIDKSLFSQSISLRAGYEFFL